MIHPCQHMKIIMDKVGQFPIGWLERNRQDNWSISPIQVGSKHKGKDIAVNSYQQTIYYITTLIRMRKEVKAWADKGKAPPRRR